MAKLSFKDSLKALEADIQHANTLALDYPREKDGGRVQMRLSYSPAAHFFLFLVQWTDCHLAGALGLLRVVIYMTYADGKTTMSVYERKASMREFYAVIFPSLLQLQRGITDLEDRKQKEACNMRYRKKDESEKREEEEVSEIEMERDEECGICMEMNTMVVLPNCTHSLCIKCYRDWRGRSQSCPFCRDSLKRVESGELWMFLEKTETVNLSAIVRENQKRLFVYIDKLPLVVPDQAFASSPYDCHVR
uniref:RING-type domain-containing protein n=1 Tax=Noccaea caerulescens TaxID=107243 RepID=A0A1J3E7U4_NOCCA